MLSDRIAIIADGELRTVGSSFFLKKRFGTGYKLICEKKNGCRSEKLMEVLKKFASDVKLHSDSQAEAIFILDESHLPIFHEAFKFLEDNSEKLKLSSFGCSLTTLEEVFLKIGSDVPTARESSQNYDIQNEFTIEELDEEIDASVVNVENFIPSEKVQGITLLMYQCEATILKKLFYLRRNYDSLIWYGCLSILLIYTTLADPSMEFSKEDSLKISLDTYKQTSAIVELQNPRSR